MAASFAFSSGTTRREIFLPRASIAIGSAPRTPRTPASKDSSPTRMQSGTSFSFRPPYATRIPRAIGKSKPEPFVNIRRSKVDRDVGGRDVVAAVLERRPYAIPTLTDGGIGQTDGMKWSSIVLKIG